MNVKNNTIQLTVAQALLKFLENQYIAIDAKEHRFVDYIFGIFGHGNVTGLGEAIVEGGYDINFVQGHNEQGMAHSAIAYAKQWRRLKVCGVTSSIGPGATNMLTAAATATSNRIPLLLLPGDIFVSRQPDPVLQQIEHAHNPSISVNDAFKPLCTYWDRISRPEQIMSSLINALRVLTDPAQTGAVCISLPQDIQSEAYNYPLSFFEKRIHRIARLSADSHSIQEAVQLLKQSTHPLIVCGGGVKYSLAEDTLSTFAQRHSIPVVDTQAGKSALLWQDEMLLGGIGVCGTKAANICAKKADLVLHIGTRLNDFTTASKWIFQNKPHFIGININSFDSHKLEALSLHGDAKTIIHQIDTCMEESSVQLTHAWSDEPQSLKREWNHITQDLYEQADIEENGVLSMSQTRAIGMLNQHSASGDVVLCAAGSLPGDLQRLWQSRSPNTYHMEYAFSCMGYEVGAALGAKLAMQGIAEQVHNEVYCLVGDASFVMLHSELLTIHREGLKVIFIVFNNKGCQCIDNLQTSQGITSYGNIWRTRDSHTSLLKGSHPHVSISTIAQGYGIASEYVQSSENFSKALDKAKQSQTSYLIEVETAQKSMTGAYESWWRVGVAQTSAKKEVEEAAKTMEATSKNARSY